MTNATIKKRNKRQRQHIKKDNNNRFDQHYDGKRGKRNDFLNRNVEKKQILVKYFQTSKAVNLHKYRMSSSQKTGNYMIHKYNHEKPDMHLILHASLVRCDVGVVSKDTVLILLICAYEKCNIPHICYLKYGHNKYANINVNSKILSPKICIAFPVIHSRTG